MWWKKEKSNPQNQQTRTTKNILNQSHYAADKKQRGIQGVEGEGEGGGERKGIEGIAVGIEGMLGRGGSVALGTLGNEGKAGM
ncbi:hypothetical protein Godav_025515, partial [Gossypium davidsonii]|nr:hypothetical protein [Gossypium davidsonii]